MMTLAMAEAQVKQPKIFDAAEKLAFDVLWKIVEYALNPLLDTQTLKYLGFTNKVAKHGCTRWNIKIFRTAGLVRVNGYVTDSEKEGKLGGEKKEREQTEDVIRENRERAGKRARQKVYELCLLHSVDRMLTLTFKDNVTDLPTAMKAYTYFVRLMKKRFKRFDYVCVPERQKRGAVHFHFALNKFYNWNTILCAWRMAIAKTIGGTGGIFINKKETMNSVARVAKYISKYVAKTCSVDKSTGELVENDDLIAEGGKHYYATRPVEECENHVVYGKHDDIDSYMSRLRAVFIEKSREPRKIKGVRYESAVGTEAFFDEYEFSFSSKNIKKVEFFENCGDFFALESKKRLKFLDNFHKNLEISKSATFVLP